MDLKDLTPTTETVEIRLLHPNTGDTLKNDDKTDMIITVHASHSKQHKSAMHEQTNKRLKMAQNKKKVDFKSEDLEEATLDLLSKVTSSWNITYGGEKPKLTVVKAKELYNEVFWIKDQVEEALADSLDFTKA